MYVGISKNGCIFKEFNILHVKLKSSKLFTLLKPEGLNLF